MGSSGMKKKRKGGSRQHLDKVGHESHDAAAHEQQLERSAVMDVMGLGNAGTGARVVMWVIGAFLLVCAVVALIIWTV